MTLLKILTTVKELYPASMFGIMTAHGLDAAADRSCVEALKNDEIAKIKAAHIGYERKNIITSAPVCHYSAYYKQFKKTYHVISQLESILLKDRGIPSVGMPVEAMFLAEIKNLLLTAGHDLDKIDGDLTVRVSIGTENYRCISGTEQQLVKDDLYLSDTSGILSSIIYGPDYRTRITDVTKNAIYFVYGVEGVTEEQIREHLKDIRTYLSAVIKTAEFNSIEVF
jgi:DNA/RNA-binding domain of Phe-tRNA-synthetase-like protein